MKSEYSFSSSPLRALKSLRIKFLKSCAECCCLSQSRIVSSTTELIASHIRLFIVSITKSSSSTARTLFCEVLRLSKQV